jgi:hypothetical protein
MNRHFLILTLAISCFGIIPADAQFDFGGGAMMRGPNSGMEKLYGSNQTFSATMAIQNNSAASSDQTALSGKIFFDKGNSRFEMDISQMQGGNTPPSAMAQMKSMGLDHMITVSQSGKNVAYVIYPNAQSYTEITLPDSTKAATNEDSQVEITKLGEETVDGHPCVKNKAVITDKQGNKHEFTLWNAADLKNFPIKLEMNEPGGAITISYLDISFSKPDASLFIPPTGYTKYDSMQEMMQAVMMKKMGGMGFPRRNNNKITHPSSIFALASALSNFAASLPPPRALSGLPPPLPPTIGAMA